VGAADVAFVGIGIGVAEESLGDRLVGMRDAGVLHAQVPE
jgi:hypothetical protein